MKSIELIGKNALGRFALVDDEDFERINAHRWSVSGGYAITNIVGNTVSKTRKVQMHRLVTECIPGVQIDHINNDPLDNRSENLRICTTSQNGMNRKLGTNSATKYKGVCAVMKKMGLRYYASIALQKKRYNLGIFNSAQEAAIAYNNAAIKLYGEFARLNQI